MSDKSRLTFKTWQAAVSPLLLLFALLLFVSPVAAQTATPTARPGGTTTTAQFTDTSEDIVKNMGTQGYYVSQSAKANVKEADLEKSVADTVRKQKNDKHDIRIAILDNRILSAAPQGNGNARDYAKFLQGYLNNPKPETVIVVDAEKKSVGMWSDKLTSAEAQELVNSNVSIFNTKGFASGADTLAQKTADKIEANQTGGTVTTGVIILVIALVIGGALFFMYTSTNKRWKQQIAQLQGLAGQVSSQVLNLNDTLEYLPDAVKTQAKNIFTQASSTFSNANNSLGELEKTSPWAVMFKSGEFQRKLQMTGSQLETSRNGLAQVQRTVDSSTHM